MDMERSIAADNRMSGALAVLLSQQNVSVTAILFSTQCSSGSDAVIWHG